MNYIKEATRTESMDLFEVKYPRLLHAAMGINTEVIELLHSADEDSTNLKEEFGDVLWYCAIFCDDCEVTFDNLLMLADYAKVERDPLWAMVGSAGDAMDCLKRACFYGVDLDTRKMGVALGTIILAIKTLAMEDAGWTLEDLQEANIAKLRRRYGDKFTTEAAVNRDYEAERQALIS